MISFLILLIFELMGFLKRNIVHIVLLICQVYRLRFTITFPPHKRQFIRDVIHTLYQMKTLLQLWYRLCAGRTADRRQDAPGLRWPLNSGNFVFSGPNRGWNLVIASNHYIALLDRTFLVFLWPICLWLMTFLQGVVLMKLRFNLRFVQCFS